MPRKKKEPTHSHPEHRNDLTHELARNLIELQKVHADLAEKFDKLSKEISQLLNLFEMAAKSFAQHPANQVSAKDTEFLDKIDKLLDQNKLIAKGLTMMEEKMKEKVYGFSNSISSSSGTEEIPSKEPYQPSSRPLPKF